MSDDAFTKAVSDLLKPSSDSAFKATTTSASGKMAGIYAFLRGDRVTKAQDIRVQLAFKAEKVDAERGIIVAKLSKADVFDRESEMIPLDVLERATFELVKKIGLKSISVDVNHKGESIPCDVLAAWLGAPMPDEKATYVMLRPHDRSIFNAAKEGRMHGLSWSGAYKLRPAA
jgi:hypothetical protein